MKNWIKKNERYIKTFVEAFASYIALNIVTSDFTSWDTIKAIFVGALASALSVLLNMKLERDE